MSPKLILFNGPPRSGKDTGADYVVNAYGATAFKMSQPIKDGVRACYGLSDKEVADAESLKDEPLDLFFGKSYREAQISFSEDWLKKFHEAKRIFGRLALRRIRKLITANGRQVFVCSDCGFHDEVLPLLYLFQPRDILLLKVARKGTSFASDSRSYIHLDGALIQILQNNGDLRSYYENISLLVEPFLYH